ncbi:C40 family peptidase [Dactylosporangium sp. NPDC005555]|uniref:C40 family peptidase n=1 Tax=Dactylosporangium sp. NPDC005555 TaxID=3154889 RepID=UPI0033A151EE
MTTKILTLIIAACVGAVVVCTAGLGLLSGRTADCTGQTGSPAPWTPVGVYTPEQVASAATIVTAGATAGVPARGWVIAVAVAIQESSLRNLPDGPDDSAGLFQQRPSQGWGTREQILDPVYASTRFYTALLAVDGWQQMPLTDAGQAVQRSAYPAAYARWETDATILVDTIVNRQPWRSALTDGQQTALPCTGGEPDVAPADYQVPPGTSAAAATAITWALAQLGTPYAFGGDCTAAHSGVRARQCDCSSLVQIAYRHAGVTIPRTTTDQVHAGTGVALADIAPGDLVFIPGSGGTRTRPGHVGMYLGSSLLIQAPHTGDVVKISPLSRWRGQVAAIRRVAK